MWTGNFCYGLIGSIPYPVDEIFQNVLLALDTWEASLLDNINFHMDIFTAIGKMVHGDVLVATDNSDGDTDMSFGWNICTKNGDPIAEHAGLAFGQASSFQAEGYGVLLALSFLYRANEYTASTTNLQFKLYLDNDSVITRIKKQQSYSHDFYFNTLTPD
eukprot:12935071-Ditylum_brightwellii.AAC.1